MATRKFLYLVVVHPITKELVIHPSPAKYIFELIPIRERYEYELGLICWIQSNLPESISQ